MKLVSEPGTWSRTRSPDDIGAFLREARRRAGLSQDELADELEIDRRVLQRIESGESTLYIRRVFSLLDRLGVDMELRQR